MGLIEEEIARREKPPFKNKISNEYNKIKKGFAEKREFNHKIKAQEKSAYHKELMVEARKYGKRKAKQKYKKKTNKSRIKVSLSSGKTPGFMEMPKNKEKKEKSVFDW